MMAKKLVIVLGITGTLAWSGCGLPTVSPNSSNPIRTVAVLPMVNNTNDVDAPAYVREQFVKELGKYYYVIKPVAESDQILKDQMGVTLGEQLDMTTSQKLGETLGVDGVFYGSLEDFSHKVTGAYNVKRVRLRSKLVDCKTGQTVWRNGVGVKSVATTGLAGSVASAGASFQDRHEADELKPLFGEKIAAPWQERSSSGSETMGQAFMKGLAEHAVSKMLKVPLYQETSAAVNTVLHGLSPGPGR